MIKKTPLPISALTLGLAALGNLLQSYSETVRLILGGIGGALFILLLLKIFLHPSESFKALDNPIVCGVASTFPMSLMLFSVYLKPLIGGVSLYLWYFAIGLHLLLILKFAYTYVLHFDLKKVFASYFVLFCGIAVAGLTAPAYQKPAIGEASFWFAFACWVALIVPVTMRYLKLPEVPDPAKQIICIYAAPLSLCLAAYVDSVSNKSFPFMMAMWGVATLLSLFSLYKAIEYLGLPFFPSLGAYTFPFVITAIASKKTMAAAAKMGHELPFLKTVVLIETVIATIFVLYTLARYLIFLFSATPTETKKV